MSSIRGIREQLEQQHQVLLSWWKDVQMSRIMFRFGNDSYIDKVGVYVRTVVDRATAGWEYQAIIDEYPGLTQEDIKACLKFTTIHGKSKLF
jgi:uncharacterized protein (DUF433 family)